MVKRKRRCIGGLLAVMLLLGQMHVQAADKKAQATDGIKQAITLEYCREDEINDKVAVTPQNVVKYSIVLLNEDGTVSYQMPQGVVIPKTYTYQTSELPMSAATFAQMGLSIPGYTLDNGWAFFWWTGNYSGSMYKVPTFKNFGRISDNYPNYNSFIGFQGLFGNNLGGTGSQSAFASYVNTQFENTSKGRDYVKNTPGSEGYYAYNPTGTLRIVFKQVSDSITYKANFVDAFDGNQEAGSYRQIDQNQLQMHKVEGSWNQATNSYQWYGTLQTVTAKVPDANAHEGYRFVGWYTDKDAYGNGTGKKITVASDDERQHGQDVTYYACWEAVEPPVPEPLEELPNTGGTGYLGYGIAGIFLTLACLGIKFQKGE